MFDFSISSQVRRGGFSIAGGRPSRLNGSVKGVRIKTYPLCLSSSQKSPSWRLLHGAGRQAPKRKASAKADAFLFGRIRGLKTPGLFTVYLINSRPAIWPAALLRRKSGTASAAENAQGRLRYPHASKMPKEGPVNGSKPQNKMRLVETSRILFWQREKDSNPHKQSQSLSCYPYTIPLFLCSSREHERYYSKLCGIVKGFLEKFFLSFLPSPDRPPRGPRKTESPPPPRPRSRHSAPPEGRWR